MRVNRFSLSKSAIISCLLAVSALTTIGISAYKVEAESVNNNVQAADASVTQDSSINTFIFDDKLKKYKDLNKASKVSGIDFKVPDYVVDGYAADSGISVIKQKDNTTFLSLSFSKINEKKEYFSYNIEVFKEDPIKLLTEDYDNGTGFEVKNDVSTTERMMGSIKGEEIKITETYSENGNVTDVTNIKYFSWQDDGVYYLIKCNEKSQNEEEIYNGQLVDLKEDDVTKIVNSMKKPQNISNVKYFSDSIWGEDCYSIYDTEDLENSYKDLGFTPKYISKINDDTEIKGAHLIKADNKKRFELNYIYKEKDKEYSKHFKFNQTKDASDYNDIKKEGLNLYKFIKDYNKISKSEKINIKNKDVYKIKEEVPEKYQNALGEYKYIYMWEDNGVYCSVESTWPDSSFDSALETIVGDILDK